MEIKTAEAAGPETRSHKLSPFIDPGPRTSPDTLAIIQLSRDNTTPVYLRDKQGEHDGYAEGVVLNTRFGSFPHSTLLNIPWGSQVRASAVDTGSRGRKRKRARKDDGDKLEKSDVNDVESIIKEDELDDSSQSAPQETKGVRKAPVATSGFIHILPPTPEIWTNSLPHRTQVVYVPDYSYILHRIRARPGTRIIEAGAGSGSFTHASARAVYNGRFEPHGSEPNGKVFSFEFHEQRFNALRQEISDHGLDDLVEITHRDVYEDGFLVNGESPEADAVFLDLPAPWKALPHLARRRLVPTDAMQGVETDQGTESERWVSPLNPKKSVYICTFSPCIEQVTQTVSEMRRLGWVNIEMVEIAGRKINVSREKIGLNMQAERGMQQTPRDVAEAIIRLKEIEVKAKEHMAKLWRGKGKPTDVIDDDEEADEEDAPAAIKADEKPVTATGGTDGTSEEAAAPVKPWIQGQLVTKTEPEIKAHTSYLVFATLPREWTEADEAAAAAKWPCGGEKKVVGGLGREARKEEKRALLEGKKKKKESDPVKEPTKQEVVE
ncbi:tRNA (Adenine(58)-N(1))-methyltransferase catalytic subunit trm61 [Pleurostoma richardsiae]|uniref:tRNA (adenine(58)-N(1))-methyltransferase catalytic subunit TRM61 n=1 Tax=Pleurostoma richardsiae TaxID=41990 RepID=A0AA38RPP1_9PEZI|nr:tRNA (Adenine(58)-N(1))-methyltransferase catalytic subunit trm61 [Pleurostoma richardsiae]